METILICNSKGGVGKSLVADELAFSLERAGVAFNFYDLDAQGGTLHKPTTQTGAAVSIVDTAAGIAAKLADWIKQADIVVIPTRCTSRDIEPLLRMKQAVEAKGQRVVYVLNCWTRYRAARDFREWLEGQVGNAPILTLPQSEQFVQAGAYRVSVVEHAPRSRAARATQELCKSILALVGINV